MTAADVQHLKSVEQRLLWLSHWMIHHANHIRPKLDGIKTGGHQASSASMVSIMTALYFSALRPEDRVAVKPHAAPVLHAMHYLVGTQTRARMENFRGLGGAQSYPSRTKDRIDVGFSTGSVGLGVASTACAALRSAPVRLSSSICVALPQLSQIRKMQSCRQPGWALAK